MGRLRQRERRWRNATEGAQMAQYKTIEGRGVAEIVEKKSRFIGQIAHAETEDSALDFLEEVRSEHRTARHNVYAYVVCEGGRLAGSPRIRYSDDGEPSKTAGVPTLETIQHADLSDVVVVITRYFGGTLLGTGGLVRAYTQATQAAIEAAHVVTMQSCVDITVNIPYAMYDQVLHRAQKENAQVISADFTDAVFMTLRVLHANKDAFIEMLTELLHGQSEITVSSPFNAAW